jgi:hypothetical protein
MTKNMQIKLEPATMAELEHHAESLGLETGQLTGMLLTAAVDMLNEDGALTLPVMLTQTPSL